MDPLPQPYAPPEAAIVPIPVHGDPLGWALLAAPVAGGLAEAFLPEHFGLIAGYGALLVSVILIGVDAARHKQAASKHVVGAVLLWLVFYPLYMHRRAAWGAPRRLGLALIAMGLFFAGAFYQPLVVGPSRAYVQCKPAGAHVGDGFACTIEHRNGSHAVKVCWNLALTCASGPDGVAHVCGSVKPKETSRVDVPFDHGTFTGAGTCDKLTKIDVQDLVLTAE